MSDNSIVRVYYDICFITQAYTILSGYMYGYSMTTQQTMTCDFTCSVSEFTSSTGLIHVNSPDSVNKFRYVFTVKSRVFHVMTCSSSDPLRLGSNSFKPRDNRQNTCIHVKTRTGGAVPNMNQHMTRANWFRNGSLFAVYGYLSYSLR